MDASLSSRLREQLRIKRPDCPPVIAITGAATSALPDGVIEGPYLGLCQRDLPQAVRSREAARYDRVLRRRLKECHLYHPERRHPRPCRPTAVRKMSPQRSLSTQRCSL